MNEIIIVLLAVIVQQMVRAKDYTNRHKDTDFVIWIKDNTLEVILAFAAAVFLYMVFLNEPFLKWGYENTLIKAEFPREAFDNICAGMVGLFNLKLVQMLKKKLLKKINNDEQKK